MAATVQVEVHGANDVLDLIEALPERVYAGARTAFSKAVFASQAETLSHLSGNPLQTRTGQLARSIRPEVTGSDLATLTGRLYSDMVYAPIQEAGGTVTAKRAYMGVPGGPYLNIPTQANKTPAGVQRMTAQQVFAQGGHIRRLHDVFGYGVFLGDQMMFILKKQVTIPARLGMRQAADDQIPTLLSDIAALELE